MARLFSAQDARGTSSKLVLYRTLLENTVEFVPEFAALQSHTEAHTYYTELQVLTAVMIRTLYMYAGVG